MSTPLSIPHIHDEPVASVLRILQLEESKGTAPDTFVGYSLPQVRRVYGGQVIAQALLAAAATVEDRARLPHSLHAYFLRGGDPSEPLSFKVDRLRDGRSFSARHVAAIQEEKEILTLTTSFQKSEVGIERQASAPTVPNPLELPSALELFRTIDHPVAKFLGKTAAFDVRHVQKSLYTPPAPEESTTQELWMQPRAQLPAGMPQVIHRALLAYVIDQVMLEPSLRSAGITWSTAGLSLASLDHAMWFHRDVDVREWLLFVGESTSVGGSRVKADIKVFDQDGILVASAAQEGMMRLPTGSQHVSGRWTFAE